MNKSKVYLDLAPIGQYLVRQIQVSQLKFLYPLKTLVFSAFSPLRFGPFPSFFSLREEMRETFFRPSLQPYPAALRKFAWPLWWRGRKCSSWYLHQNVPAAPAHPWVLPREEKVGRICMPLRYNKDKRKNPVFSRVSAFVVAYSIPFPTLIVNEKSVE